MELGFENFKKLLSQYDNFIISTHESPDADGIGAEIALNALLLFLSKKSIILNSDPVPEKFDFIDIENDITVYNQGYSLPEDYNSCALIVLDTNDFENIGTVHTYLESRVQKKFIIDHHEGGGDKVDSNYIKVEASSACEIIYDILCQFDWDISSKAAQALYAGILFDTGSFRYPKTTSKTFRIAAHLVEAGANPFTIYEKIYENNSMASFELRRLMLASMEIHYRGRLILLKLTPEMLKKSGAPYTEGEMNINLPLTIKGVVASAMVKQDFTGPVKVSLRTKGDYDVGKLAMVNGGGGHKNASGYKSKVDFEATCEKAVQDMRMFFPD